MTDRFPDPTNPSPPPTIRADLRPRRHAWARWAAAATALLLLSLLGAAFGWRVFLSDLPKLPVREALWAQGRTPGMSFLDRNGEPIATRGSRHGEKVTLKDLPPHVAHAFLAAEDHRFYEHGAVDPVGILRAARANWQAGDVVQGGSTLTQQLAKTIWLTPDQTFKRKVQEAILATRLERVLSKDEVLELYLNRIFFGSNAFGIDAAARVYFGKSAKELNLSEAALLAALPKAPSRLRPTRDMAGAVLRSHVVLRRMQEEGWITQTAADAAAASPPVLAPPAAGEGEFGYALDLAAVQAQALAGKDAPDLIVRLTIDPRLQGAAADIVQRVMGGQGKRAGAEQAALIALDQDGAIRALVGGVDHSFSAFDRAVQARRQPGSAFKPFIYAAALDAGVRPSDIRKDAPVRLGPWAPQNFGGGYRGNVTVEEALVRSINTVSVRLAQEAKPEKIGELVRRFGFEGLPRRPELSVALGAYEVSLMELAGGYQVFQRGGRRFPPYLIERITTAEGRMLFERRPSSALQVYDPGHARQMVQMLQGVVERGTGRRAAFGRPAAGKTGTSQDFRDAWFVGFTPDWVAGVWVGNDDNTPMNRVTGGDLPAEIWRRFMIEAHSTAPSHAFAPTPLAPAEAPAEAQADDTGDNQSGFYNELSDAFGRAAAAK